MRNIILVLVLLVSGIGFGQTQEQVDVMMEECDCDSSLAVGINGMMGELNQWKHTTRTFKTGDNDAPQLKGLLKDIFTDESVKHMYGIINPRILELKIGGFKYLDDDEHITYDDWVTNYIKVYDTSKYEIKYRVDNSGHSNTGEKLSLETIYVIDKITGESVKTVFIYYNNDNLRSIIDKSVVTHK